MFFENDTPVTYLKKSWNTDNERLEKSCEMQKENVVEQRLIRLTGNGFSFTGNSNMIRYKVFLK